MPASGEAYSAWLWLMPSLQGTKTIAGRRGAGDVGRGVAGTADDLARGQALGQRGGAGRGDAGRVERERPGVQICSRWQSMRPALVLFKANRGLFKSAGICRGV